MNLKLDAKTIGLAFLAFSFFGAKKATASTPTLVIPKGSDHMTLDQLRALAHSVGFTGDAIDIAAAVAMAESGGFVAAVGDHGNSFGLFQVNKPSHPKFEPSLLLTPSYNAAAAFEISKQGKDWSPWTTYRNGAYQKYLPTAPEQQLAPVPVAGELEEAVPSVTAVLEEDEDEKTDVGAPRDESAAT